MINNINKYKIKTFKFLKIFKFKEFNYNFISTIKKDNIFYNFLLKNYILLFFINNFNYLLIKKSNLKLRCNFNNNSKSLIFLFGLNRIALRKYISYGLINGFYKSSW